MGAVWLCVMKIGVKSCRYDQKSSTSYPCATLSFVTPFVAIEFDILPKILIEPFSVSAPVGDLVVAKRVYRKCLVSLSHRFTLVD